MPPTADEELQRLRDEQPLHPKCVNCRNKQHERCLYLTRPTSCSCSCPWLLEGRQPQGAS